MAIDPGQGQVEEKTVPNIKLEDLEGKSPTELFNAVEKFKIESMKDSNPEGAKGRQIALDNPNKTILMDARNGAKMTIFDGDKETINPMRAHNYEQGIAKAGSVDAFVEGRVEAMKQAGMPQASIDKETQLMREANGDGAQYAKLRFENNAFFAEQAKTAGMDPAGANDIRTNPVVRIEKVFDEEGKPIGKTTEPEFYSFDPKAMVPLYENGSATAMGGTVASFELCDAMGVHLGFNANTACESLRTFYDEGIEKYGSVEAFAEHIKKNGAPEAGISPTENAELCQNMSDAILQSEGKSEYYAAAMFRSMKKEDPERELSQKNTQDTLLMKEEKAETESDGPGTDFGNLDLKEIMNMLVAIFKGNLTIEQAMNQITNSIEKKEEVADNKDPKAEKIAATEKDHELPKEQEPEGQYIHYTQTEQTAGAPIVNKEAGAENYVALETQDGGQKSLKEGFNDTANNPPTTRMSASFDAIKTQFGILNKPDEPEQQPDQPNNENRAETAMVGMMG